jgi:integrase
MRLLWTTDQPAPVVRQVLSQRGYGSISAALPPDGQWRIGRRFPVLVDSTDRVLVEPFRFLFDVGFIRGSTRSFRTLETYAECLCDWLAFAEAAGLPWRQPTSAMLATYRDHLLGTVAREPKRSRPLSRRTVNLRLTVSIEFYKYVAELPDVDSGTQLFLSRRLASLRRLRVRLDRRRPRALSVEQCRLLCDRLRGVHRLIFQWALCTGLRTASLVSIPLGDFLSLLRSRSSPRLMQVRAKGGKTVSVHVPQQLLEATVRYVEIERVLSARSGVRGKAATLFLNSRGRPVTSKSYYRAFCRAREAVGLAARPHQARSTFATRVRDKLERLARGGAELDVVKIVQALLAHADARTTEQYLESIDVPSIDVLGVLDELSDMALDAASGR